MSSTETLQMAQILADLNGLQNTDPTAAHALLTAHKTLNPVMVRRKSQASILPDPPKFDRLGRRIVKPIPTTPTISRMNSNYSSSRSEMTSGASSEVPTPLASPEEDDHDMQHAKALIHLYDMRSHFEEMGIAGLGKAKYRVDAVVEKYAKKDLDEREKVAKARQLGVSG